MSAMRLAFRRESGDVPRYYPGTCTDAYVVTLPFRHEENESKSLPVRMGFACCALVDLPLSAVFDTIFLPVDIWGYEPRK